jgi:hypothetical protein
MSERSPLAEYLVISRGQWDGTLSREEIQNAIDRFYTWLDQLVDEGKMKRGQRLMDEGKTVARKNVITDGPFGESKEVIGGYWFILARNLEEAAQIARSNPCLECGLFFEIRPIDPRNATPENTRQS